MKTMVTKRNRMMTSALPIIPTIVPGFMKIPTGASKVCVFVEFGSRMACRIYKVFDTIFFNKAPDFSIVKIGKDCRIFLTTTFAYMPVHVLLSRFYPDFIQIKSG